jgi:UDP-N-acetylmuramoyl-tripeptide--D-alanyl-D-alanine ligase
MRITIKTIAAITGGVYTGNPPDKTVENFSTDTRQIEAGDAFIAIKGENFDGNDYICEALEKGAAVVITERDCSGEAIVTDDALRAFGLIAREHKRSIAPIPVAVTGSVGKTTTKEFIHSVLSQKFPTHKTTGNLNNEVGLPKSMLALQAENKAAVFELGMSGRGEIERMSTYAEPDIAVITNIGSSHIEKLGSRENIRDAKMEIIRGMKRGGLLILNGDETLLADAADVCGERGIGVVYAAIQNLNADYVIRGIRTFDDRTLFDLNDITDIEINTLGTHNVLDASYAYIVGKAVGMEDAAIRQGLLNFQNTGMRQKIYGCNGYTIIEDCYNAAPESMGAALSVLDMVGKTRGGRKIAVLGDMRELGDRSAELHYAVGVAINGADVLVTFGSLASHIADGAVRGGKVGVTQKFTDIDDIKSIGEYLKTLLKKDDIILFKASRAVRLERIIELLKGE